jgi:hypothetical protein
MIAGAKRNPRTSAALALQCMVLVAAACDSGTGPVLSAKNRHRTVTCEPSTTVDTCCSGNRVTKIVRETSATTWLTIGLQRIPCPAHPSGVRMSRWDLASTLPTGSVCCLVDCVVSLRPYRMYIVCHANTGELLWKPSMNTCRLAACICRYSSGMNGHTLPPAHLSVQTSPNFGWKRETFGIRAMTLERNCGTPWSRIW